MAPELLRIPSVPPAEQMNWVREQAETCSHEPIVRLFAVRFSHAKNPAHAIFECVKKLPNFQHPGGWWTHRYAATTVRRGGSCADKTVLVGAIAVALGLQWRPVWVPAPPEIGSDRDHVAPQFCNAQGCWWADPSWTSAAYGESPELLIEQNLGQDHRRGGLRA